MSIKINGTEITFDLYDVLWRTTSEQATHIADALSLNSDVRRNVVDNLLLGETELRSSAAPDDLIAERKRVLEGLGGLRDDQIAALESELASAKRMAAEDAVIIKRVWSLYHAASDARRLINAQELYNILYGKEPDNA